jgi:hypothetical protein
MHFCLSTPLSSFTVKPSCRPTTCRDDASLARRARYERPDFGELSRTATRYEFGQTRSYLQPNSEKNKRQFEEDFDIILKLKCL